MVWQERACASSGSSDGGGDEAEAELERALEASERARLFVSPHLTEPALVLSTS